jgi:hypothetical protein
VRRERPTVDCVGLGVKGFVRGVGDDGWGVW